MSNEHLILPEDKTLTASHVLTLTSAFEDVERWSSRELKDVLLRVIQEFPSVVSANLLLIELHTQMAHFAWQGLDGELAEGDPIPLDELPWKPAIDCGELWIESNPEHINLEGLPTLEDPFKDRCLLPIRTPQQYYGLLIIHSNQEDTFVGWDPALLGITVQFIGHIFQQNKRMFDLSSQLRRRKQKSSLHPSALEAVLHTSQTVLAQTKPIATYLQHNLKTLQSYHRSIQEALDFYSDEIRLHAPKEGLERIETFARHKNLKEIRADLDSVVEDSTEGIFQLRYFLNHIRELQDTSNMSEQLSFDEIVDPVFALVFADKAIHVHRSALDEHLLYGNRTRLQHALIMLLFTIQKHMDLFAPAPQLEFFAEQHEEHLSLYVSCALSNGIEPPAKEAEEFLFLQHVMEEHSGSFSFSIHEGRLHFALHFPIMFSEEAAERDRFSMEALELPALESGDEISLTVDPTKRQKLVFLGTDQRFLRSLRRALAPSFEVYLASSRQAALDLLQAHNDVSLLLCDLQEGSDETLAFLEALQTHSPQWVPYTTFLVGERMSPEALELSHRISLRTLYRHASPKELETFIRKRVRFV